MLCSLSVNFLSCFAPISMPDWRSEAALSARLARPLGKATAGVRLSRCRRLTLARRLAASAAAAAAPSPTWVERLLSIPRPGASDRPSRVCPLIVRNL